jgi:hypothetical protein
MSDPAQQAAARATLAKASHDYCLDRRDFIVFEVVRRRRANSKAVFYRVGLGLANGVRLTYLVSDDGRRVDMTRLVPPPFPPPIPVQSL